MRNRSRSKTPPTRSGSFSSSRQAVSRSCSVHGIFGDAIDTWKHSNGSTLFKLVDTVPGIAGQAEMLAYGFESHLFKAGSFDINQAANRLHLRLDFHGVLNYAKIVFVGHSMGGLVILRELLSHRDLLPRVPLSFSTPRRRKVPRSPR